jgi:predicted permease
LKQVLDHVKSLPGVVSSGASSETPLGFQGGDTTFSVEGNPPINPENVPITSHRLVTSDYLKTLGVTLIEGRLLDEHDTVDSTPVVVISEELARQSWPAGVDPIGKRIKRGRPDDATYPWMVVVGVLKNVKEDRFNFRVNRPVWYLPYEQAGNNSSISLLVETTGDPTALTSAVQNAIHAVDPDQAVANVATMQSVVANVFVTERFSAILMASLAVLGLVLAAVGLYGMIAYTVNQRKGEMGLRIALGATGRDVIGLVINQGMKPVLIGAAIGLVFSAIISGILQYSLTGGSDLLFGISLFDPATYISVCGFLISVALIAILIPAARASRTDPLIALRSE